MILEKRKEGKIMEFNKKGFEQFRNDVEVVLKSVAEKHGVEIECGKISYSSFDFTMQLKVTKNDGDIDGKKAVFEQECIFFGFKPEDYNREFMADGKKFKLVGFNRKSPKNNCSIYCVQDGKTYKCNDEMVKRAFAVQ